MDLKPDDGEAPTESDPDAPQAASQPHEKGPLDVILAEMVSALENVREVLARAALKLQVQGRDQTGELAIIVRQIEEHSELVRRRLNERPD